MPACTWVYGCQAPSAADEALILEQMRLGAEYRNDLVRLALEQRRQVAELASSHPDVAALEAKQADRAERLRVIRAEIRAARQESRTRIRATAGQQLEIIQLRELLKIGREELRTARATSREADAAQLERIRDALAEEGRQLRAHHVDLGLYWGTYLLAERAVRQAASGAEPPQLRAWRGEGLVAVQIQHGISVAELLSGTDTRARIVPAPGGDIGDQARLCLRVGSDGRAPRWVELPVKMHRPLPSDALVMWVIVSRRKLATGWVWRLHLSLRLEVPLHSPGGEGAVAVDVGWRLRDGGAERVGYAWDGEGELGRPLEVPQEITAALRKAEDLQSIRQKDYLDAAELMRRALDQPSTPAWVRAECAARRDARAALSRRRYSGLPPHPDDVRRALELLDAVPAAWAADAVHGIRLDVERGERVIHLPCRVRWLSDLLRRWRDQRWPDKRVGWKTMACREGDELLYQLLAWRDQEEHLYQWQEHGRAQALARRLDLYRCWAADLRQRYHTVVLETACVADLARLPQAEQESDQRPAQRHQRHLASTSELRAVLQSCGLEVALVPHRRTTLQCSVCLEVEKEVGEELVHTCSRCGHSWDQDLNAARNLLRLWREPSSGGQGAGSARTAQATQPARRKREGWGFGAASRAKRAQRSNGGSESPVVAGG